MENNGIKINCNGPAKNYPVLIYLLAKFKLKFVKLK